MIYLLFVFTVSFSDVPHLSVTAMPSKEACERASSKVQVNYARYVRFVDTFCEAGTAVQ